MKRSLIHFTVLTAASLSIATMSFAAPNVSKRGPHAGFAHASATAKSHENHKSDNGHAAKLSRLQKSGGDTFYLIDANGTADVGQDMALSAIHSNHQHGGDKHTASSRNSN